MTRGRSSHQQSHCGLHYKGMMWKWNILRTRVITIQSLPSNHNFYDDNICHDLPVYVDGCTFHHEGPVQTGVGIMWQCRSIQDPQQYKLSPKISQYAEDAGVLTVLQQAAGASIKESSALTPTMLGTALYTFCYCGRRITWRMPEEGILRMQRSSWLVTSLSVAMRWESIEGRSKVTHKHQGQTKMAMMRWVMPIMTHVVSSKCKSHL